MAAILHLIETGGPGGAERVCLEIASRLQVPGMHNEIAVGREGWLAKEARLRGFNPAVLPSQGSLNLPYLNQLVSLLRRHDVRVVIAHLFGAAVYASLAGLLAGVPVISVLHGQSDIAAQERFSRLKRWVVSMGSARIVFVSGALRDDLQLRLNLPVRKIAVIENGIASSFWRPTSGANVRAELEVQPSTVLIGSVGNIRPAKGYETLLQAAQIVCTRRPDVQFVVAGDTSGDLFPRLEEMRASLGLSDHLRFLGSRDDIAQLLASLDIFVLSSDTEGFSLALVEAMVCRCAVIATRSGGPESLISHGQTGLLVPRSDPLALAQAILALVDDRAMRMQLAAGARGAITERFDSGRMVSDYTRLVCSLVGV